MERITRSFAMILVALLFLTFNNVASVLQDSTNMPCLSGDMEMSLDDVIHVSDVVVSGNAISSKEGDFSTKSVTVSYYFAYKHDGQLQRLGFDSVLVTNFHFDPIENQQPGPALFFLVRQGNTDLSLYCMSPLSMMFQRYKEDFSDYNALLRHVRNVGTGDNSKNANIVLPYPNPCDHPDNGCSEHGSDCSVVNTRHNENTRCTCTMGFHGDGKNCTPWTPEANLAHCKQCKFNARCGPSQTNTVIGNAVEEPGRAAEDSITECICDHFNCPTRKLNNKMVCGSNGDTYPSICHMRRESCRKQEPILVLHYGACNKDIGIKPCGGMDHPLYTSAGLVTCNGNVACPRMHFCHSPSSYSVCCPVSSTDGYTLPTEGPKPIVPTPNPDTSTDPDCSGSGSGWSGEGSGECGQDIGSTTDIGSGKNMDSRSPVDDDDVANKFTR